MEQIELDRIADNEYDAFHALDNIDPTPIDYDTRPACAVPYVIVSLLILLCGVGFLCDVALFVGVVVRMMAQ